MQYILDHCAVFNVAVIPMYWIIVQCLMSVIPIAALISPLHSAHFLVESRLPNSVIKISVQYQHLNQNYEVKVKRC